MAKRMSRCILGIFLIAAVMGSASAQQRPEGTANQERAQESANKPVPASSTPASGSGFEQSADRIATALTSLADAQRKLAESQAKDTGLVDLLNQLTQALAALVAAALGFFAAVLVERRSWTRRKSEQIRVEQLQKILLSVRTIQRSKSRLEQVKLALERIVAGRSGNIDLQRESGLANLRDASAFLLERQEELELLGLDLKVLRCGSAVIDEVEHRAAQLRKVVNEIKEAAVARTLDERKVLDSVRVDIPIGPIKQVALDGLDAG